MVSNAAQKAVSVMKILKDKSKRYQTALALSMEFLALQLAPTTYQPDCLLAGLPVYNLQHEGHAASDETLKYRSMGTIFLAHQKGGKRTFKCTLLIEGPARLYVLWYLQYLQRRGMQEDVTLSDFMERVGVTLKQSQEPFVSPTANDKIRYMEGHQISQELFDYHKTFPIITETKIYTNMYLETLRYTESVDLGHNTMEIDCAFREYVPPMHITWYQGNENKYGRSYYSTWITDEERDALRRTDLLMNSLWALKSFSSEIVDPQIQEKQTGEYGIEGAVLTLGLLLSKTTIWSK